MDLIDVHSHVMPRGLLERYGSVSDLGDGTYSVELWGIRADRTSRGIFDMGARVRDMDSEDVEVQVLLPMVNPRALSAKVAKLVNDELREETRPYGERFIRLAVLPRDVGEAVDELDRTYRDLGTGGALLWSDMALGSHALDRIYERLEDYGIPAFIHPSIPEDSRLSEHYMSVLVGAVNEDFVAVASVILGGVLDRFPRLRLIFPHGGGAAAIHVGRIRRAAAVRADCALRRDPLDYMRSMYFDSAVYSADALKYLVSIVGADRVLLGTDYPADIMDWRGVAGRVQDALGRAGLDAIGRRNPMRALGPGR